MTNNVQGNSHQTISAISQQKLYKPEGNGSYEREETITKNILPRKTLLHI